MENIAADNVESASEVQTPNAVYGAHDLYHDLKYLPLDLSKRSIRLVQVQTTDRDDSQIICTLRHDTTASEYACLSYAWGNELESHTICINGGSLKVGRNLWEFLHAWRNKEHLVQKWLWIDSLCIDQANVPERNHQVQQMGPIYAGATVVYAWLGQDPKVEQYLENPAYPSRHMVWSKVSESTRAEEEALMDRFVAFLGLKYWTRAWITQEVMLAQKVILLAGQSELTMDKLRILYPSDIIHMSPFPNASLSRSLRKGSIRHNISLVTAFAPSKSHLSRGESLVYLLEKFKYQECRINRDRIFSLLALCGDCSSLQVDYGISDQQLLANILLSITKSLCLCSFRVVLRALALDLEELNAPDDGPFAQLRIPAKETDFLSSRLDGSSILLPYQYRRDTCLFLYADKTVQVPLYRLCETFGQDIEFHLNQKEAMFSVRDKDGHRLAMYGNFSTEQDRNGDTCFVIGLSLNDLWALTGGSLFLGLCERGKRPRTVFGEDGIFPLLTICKV